MQRSIETMFRSEEENEVGDLKVVNYLPAAAEFKKRMSPFFFLDYMKPTVLAPTSRPRGVAPHPHRGFETVTVLYDGSVAHRDSAGHSGIVGPGEVQWMTAGSGVLHVERQERAFARAGGAMHMVQIWVNLPRIHKFAAPGYQALTREGIKTAPLPGGQGSVRVIAGSYEGMAGSAKTFTPVHMLDLHLRPGARVRLPTPREFNTALLVLTGQVKVNGSPKVPAGDFLLFRNDGDEVVVESDVPATAIFLSGAPIDEPLVNYGPFVMNSIDEINQAVVDFHAGKFGSLEDEAQPFLPQGRKVRS